MKLLNFFKKNQNAEVEGNIIINKFESKYLLFQKEYPNDDLHMLLKKVLLTVFKEVGVDINNEDMDMMAWSDTYQFASIPPPLNVRSLALYALYKFRPDIIKKIPKFEVEFQKRTKLSKSNHSDKEYLENAKSYFNDKSNDKDLEKKIIEIANEFIREDPELYFNKGMDKYKQGDFNGAIIDFTNAINLNPNFSKAYFNRVRIQSILNDFNSAIEYLNISIGLQPNNDEFDFWRGLSKMLLHNHTDAMIDLMKTIKINPNHADAYFNMGLIKSLQNDSIGAKENWEKAASLGNKDAKTLLKSSE